MVNAPREFTCYVRPTTSACETYVCGRMASHQKNNFASTIRLDSIGWLSDFFGFPVKLIHDPETGFPDDRTAYGPTIISEASLREISRWFPELTFENARRRFRTNLEIGEVPPFWEDCLFGAPGKLISFHVGEVQFLGHNPCQ